MMAASYDDQSKVFVVGRQCIRRVFFDADLFSTDINETSPLNGLNK